MEARERDTILNEASKYRDAFWDLLLDTESHILLSFETAKVNDVLYYQGQYALVKWLQRYIDSAQAALDYLKQDLEEDDS